MAIVKLEKGQVMKFRVQSVEGPIEGKYGKEYALAGATASDPDAKFYAKVDVLERQASRIGKNVAGLIGGVVTFKKTPEGYLNIEKVEADGPDFLANVDAEERADLAAKTTPRPALATVPPAETFTAIRSRYREALRAATEEVATVFGWDTSEGVSAAEAGVVSQIAATLFIERNKRGA